MKPLPIDRISYRLSIICAFFSILIPLSARIGYIGDGYAIMLTLLFSIACWFLLGRREKGRFSSQVESISDEELIAPPISYEHLRSAIQSLNNGGEPKEAAPNHVSIDAPYIDDNYNDISFYNPPEGRLDLLFEKSMKQAESYRVEARIFQNATNVVNQIFTESYPLKVSPVMKVELFGRNFDIKALSTNNEQYLDRDTPPVWTWEVKPLKHGNQTLEVIASICLPIANYGTRYKNFDSLQECITVSINVPFTVKEGITENWKWVTAIATITSMILSYLNYIGFFKDDTVPK